MKTLLALLLLAASATAFAQTTSVPPLMSYQGHVTDVTGTPIGSGAPVNRTIIFKFYDTSSGGTPLYAEEQVVTIADGDFSVLIGNGTGVAGLPGPSAPAMPPFISLPPLFEGDLYLGVTVDDGTGDEAPEIAPRQRIVSAAYSFRSAVAERLIDGALQTAMLADGSVTANKIGASEVTSAKIANANVVTAHIADANITTAKLADGSVTTPKLANGAVTTAKLANSSVTADKIDTGTVGIWTPNGNHVSRSSGNVGIGQSSPGFPLNFASSHGNKIALHGNSGNHYGIGTQNNLLQLYTPNNSGDVAFGYGSATSFTETARIKGNGNVGLGLTNPAHRLHVLGNVLATPSNWNNGGTAHLYLGDTNNFVSSTQGGAVALRGNNHLSLLTGSSERIRVQNNGHVGINRTDPQTRFEISPVGNSSNQNNGLRLSTTGTPGTSAYRFADFRLKSDGSSNFRATFDVNNNGSGSATEVIRIGLNTGNVGIRSSANYGRLNVGSLPAYRYYSRARFVGSGVNSNTTHTTEEVAIFADGTIQADRIDLIDRSNVLSDIRAKNILQISDSAEDLATLLGIEITDYTQKDHLMLGAEPRKKVIAQQVEAVFPQAISARPGLVPDIYAFAEVRDGWVLLDTDLSPGDRIKLISEEKEGNYDVVDVSPSGFRIDGPLPEGEVFVYGREVPDLRRVDYDAISMLNVSATQELHRRVLHLEEVVAHQDSTIENLERRLAALEKLLGNDQ